MSFSITSMLEGVLLGLSLIIPIGTQNAYILRQGTLGKHPYLAAAVCGVCDSFLLIVGGLGVGGFIASNPLLRHCAVLGGVLFLLYYGLLSLRRALRPAASAEDASKAESSGWRMVLSSAIAFSLLNPHAILDATVLIGGLAAQKESLDLRLSFVAGTVLASWLWFYALAGFAVLLRPLFRKPMAARVLDGLVALLMFAIIWMMLAHEFA